MENSDANLQASKARLESRMSAARSANSSSQDERYDNRMNPEIYQHAYVKHLSRLQLSTKHSKMSSTALDLQEFGKARLCLLDAELTAETASTAILLASASPTRLSRAGLAILNLVITSWRTGLGGKTVLELEQDHAIGNRGEIGEHGIRVGDIVRVGEQPKGGEKKKEKAGLEKKSLEGVVVRVGQKSVQVAIDRDEEVVNALGGRLWV